MDAHLGYSHSDRKAKAQVGPAQVSNHRNGAYTKTVDSGYGALEVTVPRDRAGTFAPKMVPKGSRRLTELDDMIISLYAGGMTMRDICHHLATTLGGVKIRDGHRVVNKACYMAVGIDIDGIKRILGLWIAGQ